MAFFAFSEIAAVGNKCCGDQTGTPNIAFECVELLEVTALPNLYSHADTHTQNFYDYFIRYKDNIMQSPSHILAQLRTHCVSLLLFLLLAILAFTIAANYSRATLTSNPLTH